MKIGIEAQRLFRKKKHGMDMVVLELIRNLQEIDHENEYVIFVKPDEDNSVISETANFKIVPVQGGAYPFWEQWALPAAAKQAGCHLLHCTSNTAPITGNIPLVLTLHDIIYMEKTIPVILSGAGTAYQKFGNVYRRLIVPRALSRSSKVITVSHFEKKRIDDFFNINNAEKISAVYNGVGRHFQPVTDPNELKKVKGKYQLPDRFFFFLGNTDPKKNTAGVLKAFSDFRKQSAADYKLVMLDFDSKALHNMLEAIHDPGLIEHIVLTGYIANIDLPAIFSQASVFLYPSLRESFGIPILEAMACGTPVITSNTSSMPEVAGDAALLIDPYQPQQITHALLQLSKDEQACKRLSTAGIARARLFSWKAMAEEVLHIYRQLEASLHTESATIHSINTAIK